VRRPALLALLLALPPQAGASGNQDEVPPLAHEHRHPSGAFRFRTPADWEVKPAEKPGSLLALGAGVAAGARVLFLYDPHDLGYDNLHVSCMDVRLRGPMETSPEVKYEYDFLSATMGERRTLDSAFVVSYDEPIEGQREWRQRNLTVVGPRQSLCVIVYAPRSLWKKSRAARALLDAVVSSLEFPEPQGR
jgi:hypothetical protein